MYKWGVSRDHPEIEDKYDVGETAQLPPLGELPGVAVEDRAPEELLEATYFDTPQLRLAVLGLTLRRRTGGGDTGWHLKLPTTQGRYEVHEPIGEPDAPVPPRLLAVLAGLVTDAKVGPVATIRTRRRVTGLRDEAGRLLAEVADDRVEARSLLGPDPAATTWREWEVELARGDRTLLSQASPILGRAGARPAQHPSKLVRTLGGQVPRPFGDLPSKDRRKGPAGQVVRRRLVEQVTDILRGDPQVRLDLPDAVHRMRVAVRRVRAALAVYRPLVDPAVTDPLREELRWLAATLGEPRDAEVLLQRVRVLLAQEDAALVDEPLATFADALLTERHRLSHQRLVAEMGSSRYRSLLDTLAGVAIDPPLSEAAARPARDLLPAMVRRDWRRLEKRVAHAQAAVDPESREARLHDVRRAAKRVRYGAEPLVALYGRPATRLVRATVELQTVLGDHHDAVVVQAHLREIAERAGESGVNSFTLGVLHAREEAQAALATCDFERAWARASRPKLRRWLS